MSPDLAHSAGTRGQTVNLRIGHQDRQQAVAELQRHYAQGRLEWDELDERLGKAWAARTHADLETLFNDLPMPTPPEPAVRRFRQAHPDLVRALSVMILAGSIVLSAAFHGPFILLFFGWLFLVGPPARWRHHHGHPHHQRRASAA